MHAVRNFMGALWGGAPPTDELAQIDSGEFYLTRKDRLRAGRQCIYPHAMLTIRKSSTPHNFELAISRVYEEGEANIHDEDEDEVEDEHASLICLELEFSLGTYENRSAFSWRDLQSADSDDRFEFVANKMNKPTRDFIEMTVLGAIYEREHNQSSAGIPIEELRDFAYGDESEVKSKGTKSTSAKQKSKAAATPRKTSATKGKTKAPPVEYNAVVSLRANLFEWDRDEENYNLVGENVQAKIEDRGDVPFNYWVVALEDDSYILGHEVSSNQGPQWNKSHLLFMWHSGEHEAGTFTTWALAFADLDAFDTFQAAYSQCLWEVNNDTPWAKATAADKDYATSTWNGYAEVEMADPEEDEEESEETEETGSEDEVADELHGDDNRATFGDNSKDHNSNLVVGHNKDRAFVVRGNKIGVFSTDEGLKYSTSVAGIKTPGGKYFNPKKVMLQDQDSSMVVMNPDNPSSLYRLDLGERGQIVEEWKIHEDVPVNHMAPNSKFAPTTHEKTFVGASSNAVFRIDPRVSGKKMVDSEFKQYQTKAKFSSLTTTQHGKLAIASEKGDLRLFDQIGKNAKTALPALGDPILGVDVTADGRWVVATTKAALLVFDTTINDGRYAGQLGFDRSFPADKKPLAKRLTPAAHHVAYMGELSFTPARFNTGPDQVENAIVTSSGSYVISWDFNSVKKGRFDKYTIKKYVGKVVADNFRFGDDSGIVVAFEEDVLMVNKHQLNKPTRETLSTPTRTRARN